MRLDNCQEKEYLSPMINGSLNENTTGECENVRRKQIQSSRVWGRLLIVVIDSRWSFINENEYRTDKCEDVDKDKQTGGNNVDINWKLIQSRW